MECLLVKVFGWSLYEIEKTDVESLLRFLHQFPEWQKQMDAPRAPRKVYPDQVPWL